MKPTIAWTPVLQPLYLRDYNSAIATDECFQVCVNPERAFMAERAKMIGEFTERFRAYSQAVKEGNTKEAAAFEAWSIEFTQRINEWFARLLSFGEDKYTAAEIAQIGETDSHLLNWLQVECVRMIDAHRDGRKKN